MSVFQFKQFAIAQDNCAMKIGLDGVLLGVYASFDSPQQILDIGTGTGLLALMLAQRYPMAKIDAVEIDVEAAAEASQNVKNSIFAAQIRILQADICTYSLNNTPQYDAIVSNPPFFEVGVRPSEANRTAARHTTTLSHTDLLAAVARLLRPKGIFTVILPHSVAVNFILKAANTGLYIVKRTNIRMRPQREPERVILSFQREFSTSVLDELTIYTEKDKNYTPPFKQLTSDFYLY